MLLTRRQFLTDHVKDLFNWASVRLQPAVPVSRRVWFRRLPTHVQLYQAIVVAHLLRHNMLRTCVFTGMNESAVTVAVIGGIARFVRRRCVIVAIDHMPEYLLGRSRPQTWRRRLKHLSLGLLCRLNPRLILTYADERVFDRGSELVSDALRVSYLPDPAPDRSGFFLDGGSSRSGVLLIGNQSPRKGLASVVCLLQWCLQHNECVPWQTKLIGRLTPATQGLRPALAQLQDAGLLSWCESYVSEDELQREISECAYVWLPYEKSFESSSGVFAYAMAGATPVVSTNHGAIGYRVSRFKVGFSYPAGSITEAYQALKKATLCSPKEYGLMQRNATSLYGTYSEARFCSGINEIARSRTTIR
jgi:glycosyltransferase involved in cell wall biosynthesis